MVGRRAIEDVDAPCTQSGKCERYVDKSWAKNKDHSFLSLLCRENNTKHLNHLRSSPETLYFSPGRVETEMSDNVGITWTHRNNHQVIYIKPISRIVMKPPKMLNHHTRTYMNAHSLMLNNHIRTSYGLKMRDDRA